MEKNKKKGCSALALKSPLAVFNAELSDAARSCICCAKASKKKHAKGGLKRMRRPGCFRPCLISLHRGHRITRTPRFHGPMMCIACVSDNKRFELSSLHRLRFPFVFSALIVAPVPSRFSTPSHPRSLAFLKRRGTLFELQSDQKPPPPPLIIIKPD